MSDPHTRFPPALCTKFANLNVPFVSRDFLDFSRCGQTPSLRAQQLVTSLAVSQQARSTPGRPRRYTRVEEVASWCVVEQQQRLTIPTRTSRQRCQQLQVTVRLSLLRTAVTGSIIVLHVEAHWTIWLRHNFQRNITADRLLGDLVLPAATAGPRVRGVARPPLPPPLSQSSGVCMLHWRRVVLVRSPVIFLWWGHMGFGLNALFLLETETGCVVTLFAAATAAARVSGPFTGAAWYALEWVL